MTREAQQYPLRIPADLKERLEALAGANGRSLNAEILSRLKESLEVKARSGALVARDVQAEYRVATDAEVQMLALYRRWPPEKQLSFLVLFK